jgi:hypothetical protein
MKVNTELFQQDLTKHQQTLHEHFHQQLFDQLTKLKR